MKKYRIIKDVQGMFTPEEKRAFRWWRIGARKYLIDDAKNTIERYHKENYVEKEQVVFEVEK